MSARRASSPCFSHCQELATTIDGSEDDESRYGLRGVRVGEASHPGSPRRHGSRGTRVCPVTRRVLTYGHRGVRVRQLTLDLLAGSAGAGRDLKIVVMSHLGKRAPSVQTTNQSIVRSGQCQSGCESQAASASASVAVVLGQ